MESVLGPASAPPAPPGSLRGRPPRWFSLAIARAAAPFAGGVAMVAAADPGIVSEGVPTHARRQHNCNLMRPFPADLMRMWPISTRANKPENDDSSIIEPIELESA